MKKFLSVVVLLTITCMLGIGVNAEIQPRWDHTATVACNLSFASGDQNANVYGKIIGHSGTTSITATLTLYKGSGDDLTYLDSWPVSGTQYIIYSNSEYVCNSGETYTLELSGTVYRNGTSEDVFASDYAVCP